MKRILVAAAAVGIVAGGCQEEEGTTTGEANMEALMNPDGPEMKKTAPASYKAKFETSAGDFVIEVTRDWAPHGADRFYNLVRNGYYNGNRFFRVIPGFIVQWGMHGDPEVTAKWHGARIPDDPVKQGNELGTVTFAKGGGRDNRTVQVFVNFADNTNLDGQNFSAFGKVVSGMEAVEAINAEYEQRSPNQGQIAKKGNKYLEKLFPNLDYIRSASIVD
jgi:peptidyl-prolyl cis-trans isomerase A (cyclophilin A)